MSQFQALLADLEALSTGSANDGEDVVKSMAAEGDDADGEGGEGGEGGDADDTAIAAAAKDGEDAGASADSKAEDDGEPLGKSLKIIGEDGEEEDAIDATDLLKSLVDRVETGETNMGKAVGLLTDLVKSQATQIGALTAQVTKLASAGRGRRAVVSVADKPDLSKSLNGGDGGGDGGKQPEGITANDFMAKAMDACSAGKITGLDVARCESYLNRGQDVPANIKTKVLGA